MFWSMKQLKRISTTPKSKIDTKHDVFFLMFLLSKNGVILGINMFVFGGVTSLTVAFYILLPLISIDVFKASPVFNSQCYGFNI